MVTTAAVAGFFAGHRFAVVGASDSRGNFGKTVYEALRDHGYGVVAVNPKAETVGGDRCYPDLHEAPGPLDGVVVMVEPGAALDSVRDCISLKIPRVWLFKGLGGSGAVSDEAVRLCAEHHIEVVAGACPLMFLEPVGWFHKVHRGMRHLNGSLDGAVDIAAHRGSR
jgi:predicted CoA-binding protein